MDKSFIVGISGNRRTGKDTLFTLLQELDPKWFRLAFADQLKEDVAPLIRSQFGYNPSNLTLEQKEICRNIYIGYGMAWRAIDHLHWVKVVADQIDTMPAGARIAIVDFRFQNEVEFFRDRYGAAFKHINVSRVDAPPPTEEEEKHYRQVAAMADYSILWGNDTHAQQLDHARALMNWLNRENSLDLRGSAVQSSRL